MPDPKLLDAIPAWVRHLFIVVAAAVLTTVGQGVANGGVQSIDWQDVLNGGIAAAVTYLLLVLTPLTQQYGVGAPPAAVVIQGNEPPVEPPGPVDEGGLSAVELLLIIALCLVIVFIAIRVF